MRKLSSLSTRTWLGAFLISALAVFTVVSAAGAATTIGSDIDTDGDLIVGSGAHIGNSDTPDYFTDLQDDSLFVEGDAEIDGRLYLDGRLDSSADSFFWNEVSFDDYVYLHDQVEVEGPFYVSLDAYFNEDVSIPNNSLIVGSDNKSYIDYVNDVYIDDDLEVGGDLHIDGTSFLYGEVNASGSDVYAGTLDVDGLATADSMYSEGALDVDGYAIFNDWIEVDNLWVTGTDLDVEANITQFSGSTTLLDTDINGDFSVDAGAGTIQLGGDVYDQITVGGTNQDDSMYIYVDNFEVDADDNFYFDGDMVINENGNGRLQIGPDWAAGLVQHHHVNAGTVAVPTVGGNPFCGEALVYTVPGDTIGDYTAYATPDDAVLIGHPQSVIWNTFVDTSALPVGPATVWVRACDFTGSGAPFVTDWTVDVWIHEIVF